MNAGEQRPVEPFEVATLIESYVDDEIRDVAKYDNRELFDSSGIYSLHELAARIYQRGFNEGRAVEGWREQGQNRRERQTPDPVNGSHNER